MEVKKSQKLALAVIAAFSVFSFLFVNGHAYCNFGRPMSNAEILEQKAAKEAEEEQKELKVPDVAVFQKLWELGRRLVPGAN